MNIAAPKKYVAEFEGLRGILACWVVLGHSLVALPAGANHHLGTLMNVEAVTVFIILSGFVIFFLLGSRDTPYLPYLTARFFRLFPAYLLVLVISTLMLGPDHKILAAADHGIATGLRMALMSAAQQHTALHFLAHITMLHGLIPIKLLPYADATIVGQAWSVSVEWQFYLIAPFLFMWFSTFRQVKSILAIVAALALCEVYGRYVGSGFFGNNWRVFAFGFASYAFYKSDFTRFSINRIRLGFVASCLLGLLVARQHILGISIWLIVFYAVVATRYSGAGNIITMALLRPAVVYLGRVSYSLYLVHMQVLFCFMWAYHVARVPAGVQSFALPVGVLIVSIGAASLVHHTVEAPLQAFGKRLATRIRSTPAIPAV